MFMIVSQEGKKMIRSYEACKLQAYQDIGGIWTIGYGWTGKVDGTEIRSGLVITQDKAEYLFDLAISEVERVLNSKIKIIINSRQFDALASLTYNIGCGAFVHSTLLKLLNEGDFEGAGEEILRWNKVSGSVVRGLRLRREKEYLYFKS